MLAIYIIAFKKSRDTSSTYAGIQDGGQNSKWLPVMYDVIYISLSLHYKNDIDVDMYPVNEISGVFRIS